MSGPSEVCVDVESAVVQEWDMVVNDPYDDPCPVVIFMAEDVHLALRQGLTTWPNRGTLAVTAQGFATSTWPDGRAAVYELFPARFSDERPYEPTIYVGRWPD